MSRRATQLSSEQIALHHARAVERSHALERALVMLAVVVDYDTETAPTPGLRRALDAAWELVDGDGKIRARHLARAEAQERQENATS